MTRLRNALQGLPTDTEKAAASLRRLVKDRDGFGELSKLQQREARLRRMRKGVLNAARLLQGQDDAGCRARWAMVTLTYRPGSQWGAKDITEFLQRCRAWFARRRRALLYVWVMELTKAGIPHFHVLLRLRPRDRIPMPDKRGWWEHGATRVEWAQRAIGYLAKYASKGDGSTGFPVGARISGAGGLTVVNRIERSWWNLPRFVREVWNIPERVTRVRGGFVRTDTGEFLRTPWCVAMAGGVLFFWKEHIA